MESAGIFVCSYKRPDLVERCIRNLLNLERSSAYNIEIFLIDNDRMKTSVHVPDKVGSDLVKVSYFCEENQGVVHARNRALSISRSLGLDYIFFIDDDCLADEAWCANAIAALCDNDALSWVTGRTNQCHSGDTARSRALVSGRDAPPEDVDYGVTNNICFTAASVKDLSFDPFFNAIGSEDKHFTLALTKRGHRGAFIRSMVVDEVIRERKNDFGNRVRRFAAGAVGTYHAFRRAGFPVRALSSLASISLSASAVPLLWIMSLPLSPASLRMRAQLQLSKRLGRALGLWCVLSGRPVLYFDERTGS